MKNLKKVLALALAVIMMMSLFTVAFAAETETELVASDFTDYDEIEHKDAVALAVDLGIINGISNGDGTYKFAPNESMDRASWAKLIYFLATGDDNADAYKGANVGMTDISNSWAEGFIAFCIANNYMAGDGNGKYLPNNKITVSAGLKTMLTVLGYDADNKGYQGTLTWAAKVMTDAKGLKLMKGVDSKNTANVELTRDVAAQIIYNTLQATTQTQTVTWDNGNKYITGHSSTGRSLAEDKFDTSWVTVKVNSVNAKGEATFSTSTPSMNNHGVKANPALQGESVKVFYNINTNKPVTTYVAASADDATATFTDGVNLSHILTETSKKEDYYVNSALTTLAVYVDGAKDTDITFNTTSGYYTSVNADTNGVNTKAQKAGNEVKVYTDDEGYVEMIKITTYATKKVTGDIETKTTNKVDYVKVPGVLTGWVKTSLVNGWEGLEKGDIVLLNTDASTINTIIKADKVTGSVSKKTSSEVTIDGEAYGISGVTYRADTNNEDGGLDISNWNVKSFLDNVYDFYLDLNGTICYVKLVEGETETDVAYVLNTAWVAGSGINGSNYAEAKLLFNDGTTEVVTVAKYNGTKITSSNYSSIVPSSASITTIKDHFVTFSVNSDGAYDVVLTTADGDYNSTAGSVSTSATIVSKVAFISGGTTYYADNNTVFFVDKYDATDDESTYSIYTGYKNVPGMVTSAAGEIVLDKTNTSVAAFVFLKTSTGFEGDTPDGLVYVADSTDYYVGSEGLKIQTMYDAEGNEIEMALASTTTVADKSFYYVMSGNDENGYKLGNAATSGTESSAVTVSNSLTLIGNGMLTVGSTTYSYDDESVFVVVDLDNSSPAAFESCGSFDPENFDIKTGSGENYSSVKAVVIAGSDNVVDYIYVERTAQ